MLSKNASKLKTDNSNRVVRSCAVALSCLITGPFLCEAIAQAPDEPAAATLQEQALALKEETGTPGFGVTIMRGDEVLAEAAVGERAYGTGVNVQLNDVWHVGSITKSITATLVARLVDQGHLDWNLSVTEALGNSIDNIDPAYAEVTFRELLTHRAGLPSDINPITFATYSLSSDAVTADRLAYAKVMLSQAPETPPGTQHQYSNAGYIIAGAMIEAVMQESWETLISQEVFQPLGLDTAGFGPVGLAETINQPRGHRKDGNTDDRIAVIPGTPGSDNPDVLGPAGRIHMSLRDLATYAVAHSVEVSDVTPFLSTESLQILHKPELNNYAMGWVIRAGGALLWHNGSNGMNYAELYIIPSEGFVIALAANDYDINTLGPALSRFAQTLIRDYRQ